MTHMGTGTTVQNSRDAHGDRHACVGSATHVARPQLLRAAIGGRMFLTEEQVQQLQEICEKVAGNRTRSGSVTLVIQNNMPRSWRIETPVLDEDHVEIGAIVHIVRVALPEEELRKGRQKNRLKGKKKDIGLRGSSSEG